MTKHFRLSVVCVMFLCLHAKGAETQEAVPAGLRSEFDAHYAAWKRHCEQVKFKSSVNSRLQSEHFQAIVKMGPEALPLVAEKCIQDTNFHWIGWAWTELTRMQNDPAVNPWAKDSIRTWWEGGAELAKARSSLLLDEMKKARKEGREDDAEKARRGLRALGIFSLETLFAELERGNDDVIPIINGVLSGEMQATEKEMVLDWWSKNRRRYIVPRGTITTNDMPHSVPMSTKP